MPFPSTPTNGQTFTQGGTEYTFNTIKNSWTKTGGGGTGGGVAKVTTVERIALDKTKVTMCLDTDLDTLFRTNANNDWIEVGSGGGAQKMTKVQRLAATPIDGLLTYDTTDQAFYYGNGSAWVAL